MAGGSNAGKIKGKDLSYSKDLPPFLQRLYSQNAGHDQSQLLRNARPRRAKEGDQDDDGPTVIDESGDVLSKEQLDAMGKQDDPILASGAIPKDEPTAPETQSDVKNAKSTVVDGTVPGQKKRKLGRLVGEHDEADDNDALVSVAAKTTKDSATGASQGKKKKKSKPIKLAFDQDND